MVHAYREHRAGRGRHELVTDEALALRTGGVYVDDDEALVLTLLAEVHALDAARVDDRRVLREHLVLVDVAERDVVELRNGDGAEAEHVVVPEHHRLLRGGLRSGDVDVRAEHGGDGGIELVDLLLEVCDEPGFDLLLDLLQRLAARLFAAHELADAYPRQRDDLHVAGVGGDAVRFEPLPDADVGDAERGEDLKRGGAVSDVRQVVVANGKERGDARGGEPRDAAGELALVGLGGVARLVGVAREQDEVHTAVDSVVDGVVHRGEEVQEARVDAEILRAVDVRARTSPATRRGRPGRWGVRTSRRRRGCRRCAGSAWGYATRSYRRGKERVAEARRCWDRG